MACGSECELCDRLREAVVEIVAEQGLAKATLDAVAERARVDPCDARTHARSVLALAGTVYEERMQVVQQCFAGIAREQGDWTGGLTYAIDAMLEGLAAEPAFARFALVEVPACVRLHATRAAVRRYATRTLASLYVDLVRGPWPSTTHFEWLSGALLHEAGEAVRAGHVAELPALRERLVALIALEPAASAAA